MKKQNSVKNIKEKSFFKNSLTHALTFDDILLIPQYSEVLPKDVSLKVHFAKNIFLNLPIISSAMDTVTENKLARAMAQHGGFGVIHKNMSIQSQCEEVKKVKKYESGMIGKPITLNPDQSVNEAIEVMTKYSISGLPITVKNKLVGILTNRDLRFETNVEQKISNVMTKKNLITTKVGTTLEEAKDLLHRYRIEKLPVVDENKTLKGLITVKDIEKSKAYPLATKDSQRRLIVGAAIGADEIAQERAKALVSAEVDVLVIDTAHGHSKNVLKTLKWVRKNFPHIVIVAGNVVTEEGTLALIEAGADVIKVGVGSGSICTTRIVTGVGMPQVSAIVNCLKASKNKGKALMTDGGIRYSGDLTKALALGADFAMLGGVLAGTEESPGEMILYKGETYKAYRGMGSIEAMKKGSKDRYSQNDVQEYDKLVPEGVEGKVPYKGPVSKILHQMSGGVKAGMGYLGAKTIKNLQENAHFVSISSQGLQESHVHNVSITKEAPNYRLKPFSF